MDVDTTPTVETPAPPAEAPALESNPPPATSLADHAATFGPEAVQAETDGTAAPVIDKRDERTGRFKPSRHRAESQKAGPADAPRIAELTKKTRTVEQERDALAAEIKELKARVEYNTSELERRVNFTPEVVTPKEPATNGNGAPTFDRPKPKLEDFANAEDPYGELQQELTLWRLDKREFEKSQKEAATKSDRDAEAIFNNLLTEYNQHAEAFAKEHTDFNSVIAASPVVPLTPLMRASIIAGRDKGPGYVYTLAQHPDWQYEMHLLTDGKPITDQAVASVQRLLNSRVQAASTGSVASQPPPPVVPKPPNPVRTGPMTTGVDSSASETGSIAAHRKSLGLSSRRR